MGNLLRRRMMMQAAETGESWDFVWDYTMGLPTDNGMSLIGGDLQNATMTGSGLQIKDNCVFGFVGNATMESGVCEVVFRQSVFSNNQFVRAFRVGIGNASYGIGWHTYQQYGITKIQVHNIKAGQYKDGIQGETVIKSYINRNKFYTVRTTMYTDKTAEIIIDDAIVRPRADISTLIGSTENRVGIEGSKGDTAIVTSIKFKFNRT